MYNDGAISISTSGPMMSPPQQIQDSGNVDGFASIHHSRNGDGRANDRGDGANFGRDGKTINSNAANSNGDGDGDGDGDRTVETAPSPAVELERRQSLSDAKYFP